MIASSYSSTILPTISSSPMKRMKPSTGPVFWWHSSLWGPTGIMHDLCGTGVEPEKRFLVWLRTVLREVEVGVLFRLGNNIWQTFSIPGLSLSLDNRFKSGASLLVISWVYQITKGFYLGLCTHSTLSGREKCRRWGVLDACKIESVS